MIGEKYCDLLSKPLIEAGIRILPVPPCGELNGEERHHADMLVHPIGGNKIIVCRNILCKANLLYMLSGVEIIKSDSALRDRYPFNIALNGLIVGNLFFHLLEHTDPLLKRKYKENNCLLIPVKQGYSKCAAAVLDERSAITSDSGMAKAMRDAGIDALLIRSGHIYLDGVHSGLIGGCCGKISKNCLAFTGSLDEHPDKTIILNFLKSKNIQPVFLTENPLIDIGSILPITEEDL